MKKFFRRMLAAVCCCTIAMSMVGCGDDSSSAAKDSSSEVSDSELGFSSNILLTINHGAPASGTRAECEEADITIYTNGDVKIFMVNTDFETEIEIGSFALSETEIEGLKANVSAGKIYDMKVSTDDEATSSPKQYLVVYDENDNVLATKGGHNPQGKDFIKTYNSIKKVLKNYPIDEIVNNHRILLSQAENADSAEN